MQCNRSGWHWAKSVENACHPRGSVLCITTNCLLEVLTLFAFAINVPFCVLFFCVLFQRTTLTQQIFCRIYLAGLLRYEVVICVSGDVVYMFLSMYMSWHLTKPTCVSFTAALTCKGNETCYRHLCSQSVNIIFLP